MLVRSVIRRNADALRRPRREEMWKASLLWCLAIGAISAPCLAQSPPTSPPLKPPPVPTGVIPLPQGPLETGIQSQLPAPALATPKGDRPLRASPGMNALRDYLQNRPLSLNDAVAISLAVNRDFATSISNLLLSQGRVNEARAALSPTFGLGANITEYDAPTTISFGSLLSGSGGKPIPPITSLEQFNPILTASVSLPIDIAGSLRAAVSQAQFEEVAARIEVNRTRNQIVLNVKTAFYNTLRAQAQVAVATESVNNTLARLSDAEKNYAAGTSPRFDVLTAQRDVADAQQSLINAKAQVSLTLGVLKNTIGIDIQTPIKLTDENAVEYPPGVPPLPESSTDAGSSAPGMPNGKADNPVPPVTPAPPVPVDSSGGAQGITPLPPPPRSPVEDPLPLGADFDQALKEAMETRPEILEADANISAAQKGIQYARRSSLPSVSLSLGYTYTPNATPFSGRVNVGAASLGVSVPIFDGGLARARVQEARAQQANAENARRSAVDQVALDVQQAYIALLQARDRVAVTNVGVIQAREAFRLSRVRYQAGVSQQTGISPQLELSNSQIGLAQAESNQVNALYDYNNARSQLDRAIGRYSYVKKGPGYPAIPSSHEVGASGRP